MQTQWTKSWLIALSTLPLAAFSQPVVTIDSGSLGGQMSGQTWSYKNIPYAAPPTGDLRWRPPQAVTPWSGVRDATAWGPQCPQLQSNSTSGPVIGDEDCLQLNVWTPAAAAASSGSLPVIFWIPGGGNLIGGATEIDGGVHIYDGSSLAAGGNAVVVTVNYRLGPLGFLAAPVLTSENDPPSSGNYGILDLIAALEWVNRNAAQFGGDPSRVTIAGQSAGALNVCTLIASPLAAGLFQSAIMESGGCSASPLSTAETFGTTVFNAAGCGDSACMRGLSAEAVLEAEPEVVSVAGLGSAAYGAVVDGWVLTAPPLQTIAAGSHNAVPVIVGNNTDETSRSLPPIATDTQYRAAIHAMFPGAAISTAVLAMYPSENYSSPFNALVAVTTDSKFACLGATRAADALRDAQSPPVFRYVFSHALDNGGPTLKAEGAWHGLDVLFLFGTLNTGGYKPTAGEISLSGSMQNYWGNFAAGGDPNGSGTASLPVWPVYSQAESFLQLDTPIGHGAAYRKAYCEFWDALAVGAGSF